MSAITSTLTALVLLLVTQGLATDSARADDTTLASVEHATSAPEPDYPHGHIYDLVHRLAPRYDVDPQLALAIIRVESAFDAPAVSP